MLKRFMLVIALVGIIVSSAADAAAAGGIRRIRNRGGNGSNTANDYDGGSGDSVKSIKPEDAEKSKDGKSPVFLYIYDADADDNVFAKHLESLLSNKEIDQMAREFKKVKIKADGSDSRGWPEEWRQRAKKGAALLLITSDKSQVIVVDKHLGRESVTTETVTSSMRNILRYEAKAKSKKK